MSDELVELKELVVRDAQAAECPCGGYARRIEGTEEELQKYNYCGRSSRCCTRFFVCGLCKKRLVAKAQAPEAD